LPYGHQPENRHAFEVELPHDLAHILEGIMRETEAAKKRYEKWHHRQRIMFFCWCGLFSVYLVLTVVKGFS